MPSLLPETFPHSCYSLVLLCGCHGLCFYHWVVLMYDLFHYPAYILRLGIVWLIYLCVPSTVLGREVGMKEIPTPNCSLGISPQKVCSYLKISMYQVKPIAKSSGQVLGFPSLRSDFTQRHLQSWALVFNVFFLDTIVISPHAYLYTVFSFQYLCFHRYIILCPRVHQKITSFSLGFQFCYCPNLSCTLLNLLNINIITLVITVHL